VSRALRETNLEGQQTYPDFASYFEARTGKPFAVWCELESTYTSIATYRPELLRQRYQVAQKARLEHTPPLHPSPGAPEGNQNAARNKRGHVHVCSSSQGGTTTYRIARLKRDHLDIADALARGEYPSVRGSPLTFPPPRSTEIRRYALPRPLERTP
jgi:hypothetical protein